MRSSDQALEPLLYRIEEAAQLLGVSIPTINRLFDDGKLKRIKIGRSVRISAEELRAYVEERYSE